MSMVIKRPLNRKGFRMNLGSPVKREEMLEAHSMPRVRCEFDGQGIKKIPAAEEISSLVQTSGDVRDITGDSRRD